MLNKLFIFTVLLTVMAGCKSKSNAALKYNQDIVDEQQSFQDQGQVAEDNISRYYDAGHYDSIGVAGAEMEIILQKVIDNVKALPLPDAKGIDEFKKAAIEYFEFHKSYYTYCIEYGHAENDDKRNEAMGRIEQFRGQRQDAENKIHQAQQKFADANGFKMGKR